MEIERDSGEVMKVLVQARGRQGGDEGVDEAAVVLSPLRKPLSPRQSDEEGLRGRGLKGLRD